MLTARLLAAAFAIVAGLQFLITTVAVLTGHTERVSEQPLLDSFTPLGLTLIFTSITIRLIRPSLHRLVLLACAGAMLLITSAILKPHQLLVQGAIFMSLGVLGDVAQTIIRSRKKKDA